jgi:5'-nucleotidase
MHLLITNDDGIKSPGLLALVQAMKPLGKVTIVAPDRNWSASGHVKTMHRPLRAYPSQLDDGTPALACDGAPSDCVALALLGLVPEQIDLVVSGINPSANLGHDVTYSGTVTAAMEAAIAGTQAMAVSLDVPEGHGEDTDFSIAGQVARQIAERLLAQPMPEGVLLNVNVPYASRADELELSATRQGLRLYLDELVERSDPRGRPYYWIGGEPPSGVADPGTDFWALSQGLVSVTPLQLDLTAHEQLSRLNDWSLA